MNIRLDIEYDGSSFSGWARQPGLSTVEGTITAVVGRILQEEVRLSVAGRTDAGVHARGQVANFRPGSDIDPGALSRSANKLLPDTIVITRAAVVPDEFDARTSAVARSYSYSVLNRGWPSAFRYPHVYYYAKELDLDLLRRAAALVLGPHDFTAFTPTVTEHNYFQRDINISEWQRVGDLLVYRIQASSFLRNMVRVLTGTILEIGRGYRPLTDLEALLTGAGRPDAGVTAPPGGLCLEQVIYQG
ncbi:MAG: tRNA pseudouridine(38-40) synthase TruA [Thermoleophilia bacterium]